MKIIESERLIIRQAREEDIEVLKELIFNDEDVVKFTFGKGLQSEKEKEEYIKSACNFDEELGLSVLEEKETNNVIGLGGVLSCEYLGKKDYEFGFILGKRFWGKGYATEIGKAQIDYVKEKIKAPRVLALVDEVNAASINAIKKLGLSFVKNVPTDRGERQVYELVF